MLKQKKSKSHKMRGTNSHGWGHKKKHRGSGHRGGFGLAGTGARGDSQKAGLMSGSAKFLRKVAASKGIKVSDVKYGKSYFGKDGFKSLNNKKKEVLSISYIEHNFDKLVEMGVIVKEKSDFVLDTTILNYDKILGKGKFSKKITIVCHEISQSAKQAIEAAGGKVVLTSGNEEIQSSSEQ